MMKFFLIILMTTAMLTGCGVGEEKPEEAVEPEALTVGAAPASLTMEFEHEVYDPSLDTYTYIIYNDTNQEVLVGETYCVEKQEGTTWRELPFREESSENLMSHHVAAGESLALQCDFSLLDAQPEPGKYRLVKEVELGTDGDMRPVWIQAEFQLGKSVYTGDAPFGFQPLEKLPEVYGAAEGGRDGTVTITDEGINGENTVIHFFQNVSMNIPCQVRLVQEFNEGNPMVMDAIYQEGKFLWRVRSGGGITEQYFSYVVTDGTALCLSNGADWETAETLTGRELVYLMPEEAKGMEGAVSIIKEMTERRLKDGAPQYCTWSPDGSCCAATTETTGELMVMNAQKREVFSITDKKQQPVEITELSWDPEGLLIVFTENGAQAFDPAEWKLH